MGIISAGETDYHLDWKLERHWKNNSLSKLKKQNSDRLYIVDGRERIGKSLWIFQQMGAIEPELFKDPKLFASRICNTSEEFNKVAREVENGVVSFDEGFRGLSSRAALSKTNKMIIQTLMEMGQNNNIIFIALPSFFLLDVYPAMLRSDGLFHIRFDKKTTLRVWEGFNRKDKNDIYRTGIRKGWKYKYSKFKGRFTKKFPGGAGFEKAYLDKKKIAFKNMSDTMFNVEEKIKPLEELGLYHLKNKYKELGSIKKTKLYFESLGFNRSTGWYSERVGDKHLSKPLKLPENP